MMALKTSKKKAANEKETIIGKNSIIVSVRNHKITTKKINLHAKSLDRTLQEFFIEEIQAEIWSIVRQLDLFLFAAATATSAITNEMFFN